MIRTFDGSYGGRNDYAKYTLTSYNENRASGFFAKYNNTKGQNTWPGASVGKEYSRIKAGFHHGDYDRWYWAGVTFNYDELDELRKKTALNVKLEVYATLNANVAVDMKKEPGTQDMVRCDKDGNAISANKLGVWDTTSTNYVSRVDNVCTFDLTNDTDGAFAGVPRYGYCWGRNIPGVSSFAAEFINGESPLTTSKRATLYVITNERRSTLSFDACGGSGEPASVTGEGPDGVCTLTIPPDVPTKEGKKFNGWATEWLSPAVYQPGDKVTVNDDTTLYADWGDLYVSLIYKAGAGGTGSFDVLAMPGYELSLVDTSAFLKRPGKMIYGYSDTDGGLKAYDFGDRITMGNEDKILYAAWMTAVYTISYSAEGGTGAPASQTKGPGERIRLSSAEPILVGNTFLGWATVPGGDVKYRPGDVYEEDESCALRAVWKEDPKPFHVWTRKGKQPAQPYVMTEDGLKPADVWIRTENGMRRGR